MNKWLYLGLFVFSFVLGSFSEPIRVKALEISEGLVDTSVQVLKPIFQTKADMFYTATSTVALKLTDEELVKVKEEYNNIQEILKELRLIRLELIRLNKK